MWCYKLLLTLLITISCTQTLEGRADILSYSTSELAILAQCEARCYATWEIEGQESSHREFTTAQDINKEKAKCLDGLSIPVSGLQCREQCNGSDTCLESCSCVRELLKNSVRRSELGGPGPSAPWLHCRETTILSIKWECPGNPVFILEMRDTEDLRWKPINKTRNNMVTLHELRNDSQYQFRVRAIFPDGQHGVAVDSDWIRTLNYTFEPGPVTDIKVIHNTSKFDGDLLQATISWVPAWDRTCFYEVVCWTDTTFPMPVFIGEPKKFEFIWDFLKFGTNYSINIIGKSKDETRESIKSDLNFKTPQCLEHYRNDLTKCVPPKPNNLTVEEEAMPSLTSMSQVYDIYVSWATPVLQPSFHEVKLVRHLPDNFVLAHKNVFGNLTWAKFPALEVGSQYEVTVQAVSPAGSSDLASVIRTTSGYLFSIPTTYPNATFSTMSSSWGESSQLLSILLPLLLLAIVAAGLCIFKYHRHAKLLRYERRGSYIETLDEKPPVRTEYSDSLECDLDFDPKLEIPRENLLLGDVIGEGAFGIVRKGVLQEEDKWRDVAVKMLRDEPSTEDLRQFKHEINMMQSVGQHSHIVSLIGCCTRSGRLRLVVEYCAQGDLLHFMRKNWSDLTTLPNRCSAMCSNNEARASQQIKYAELLSLDNNSDAESVIPFPRVVINQMYDIVNGGDDSNAQQTNKVVTPADLLSFARQISIGMEYLANNHVVHRDLAARNVLVCADKTIKISDFGLSRDIYEENIYRKKGSGRLPVKWMAPESLLHQIYTTQSDVWSFGILLWEIVTLGGNPYPGILTNDLFSFLKEGHRMECPSNCSKELYDIMLLCWKAKSRDRPTFPELHKMLDDLLESSSPQKYLNLNLIDYTSHNKTFLQEEHHSSFRSSSGYLNSNKTASGTFMPATTNIEDTKHHYLNTCLESKSIETSTADDRNKRD